MRSISLFVKAVVLTLVVAAFSLAGLRPVNVQAAQPDLQATQAATPAVTPAATSNTAGASGAMQFPPCPSGATPAATRAATAAATTAATAAATAAATQQGTLPPTATTNPTPGYLGVRAAQVEDCGVQVVEVVEGGPAAKAQVQADDVIVAVNGTATPSVAGLRRLVENSKPNEKLKLTIQRKGKQIEIEVTLALRPPEAAAPLTPQVQATVAPTTAATSAATAAATAASTAAATPAATQ